MSEDLFVWTEKYRPTTIEECILPKKLKELFSKYVAQKEVPNLLLSGNPGMGKTTVARALLESIGADYIVINGSLNGNIDILRNEIKNFASTVSFSNSRKYVILDEADYLNPQSTQPALRNFMEEYASNCGFILTCNNRSRIIEALHSRVNEFEFKIPKEETPEIAVQLLSRLETILSVNNVTYSKAVLAKLIMKYFPDFRKTLNVLQSYSVSGTIDAGILSTVNEKVVIEVLEYIKSKNFESVRKWVNDNSDMEPHEIFRMIYDISNKFVESDSLPQLIVILADYQYKSAFVADQDINTMACFVEIMAEVLFK